jgi:hypothetical protein
VKAWDSQTTSQPPAEEEPILALDLYSRSSQRVLFMNPHIHYLVTSCTQLQPRFVARMLRIFGEVVVLEALQRAKRDVGPDYFVGICRRVERETQEV